MTSQQFQKQNKEQKPDSSGQETNILGVVQQRTGQASRVTAFDRWLLDKMLGFIGRPPFIVSLWNGVEYEPEAGAVAHLKIYDRGALYQLLVNPELHFGDLYSVGRVDVDGEFLECLETTYRHLAESRDDSLRRTFIKRWMHRPRGHSLSASRDNIYHHYDISNKFYELWLDKETMQYTCAYFPDPDLTLEQAQVAKLHHVCRKLQLKPGDKVVEAGCGWGSLARFMAKHYGVTVTAYNISHEQLVYARSRALHDGLADKINYIEDDYRNINGEYDVFVSVGMLEHIGHRNHKTLGKVIDRCLKPDGRGLVHSIGRNSPGMMNAWIERRIFPGANPPSLGQMADIFEPYDFSIQDVENLRLHYAKTLSHWWERFEANVDSVRKDFDESFCRAWRLYLVGSMAAFTTGELQLFQVVFTRADNNALPWSRAHLYPPED